MRLLLPTVLLLAVGGCGPTLYGERSFNFTGSRKRMLEAAEAKLREAMGAADVRRVEAPGNDEPVYVERGQEGTCVTSAWFTLPGKDAEQLGERFHYSWHLCTKADRRLIVRPSCVEVTRSESSTDSRECPGGRVARPIARRSDRLLDGLRPK